MAACRGRDTIKKRQLFRSRDTRHRTLARLHHLADCPENIPRESYEAVSFTSLVQPSMAQLSYKRTGRLHYSIKERCLLQMISIHFPLGAMIAAGKLEGLALSNRDDNTIARLILPETENRGMTMRCWIVSNGNDFEKQINHE